MTTEYLGRWINAGGVKTYFLTSGDGEPVVLLHGSAAGVSAVHNWQHSMSPLARAGFSVYAPEFVGYGRTEKPAWANNIEAKEKHILDFMDALCLECVYLVGNSMGGRVSLGIAASRPDRVKKMVLLGSAGLRLARPSKDVLEIPNFRPSKGTMRKMLEYIYYDKSIVTEEMLEQRYQMSLLPGADQALKSFMKGFVEADGSLHLWDMESSLPKIKLPTLLLWGKGDRLVPVSLGEKMSKILPNARLVVIDKCGHSVQIEHPQKFNDLVINFFSSTSADRKTHVRL